MPKCMVWLFVAQYEVSLDLEKIDHFYCDVCIELKLGAEAQKAESELSLCCHLAYLAYRLLVVLFSQKYDIIFSLKTWFLIRRT